jgi:hypothetical protein
LSPRMLTKRPTGRRTDSLTLLLLGPGSRLTNLELTPTTGGLIVGSPSGHGSTLGLLLSASALLLRRFNHELFALPLFMTHHVSLNEPATAAREVAVMRSRECPGDGTRCTGRWWWLWTVVAALGSGRRRHGGSGAGQRGSSKEVRRWL